MKTIGVFAGSNPGTDPAFAAATIGLADAIAVRNLATVFGGGRVGLMGILADQLLRKDCVVTGVIPQSLFDREAAHSGLTELIVVDSMHTRKATMADRADAFVALPGGLGTLEELSKVLTWRQLEFHNKPCALLNVNGYFDHLISFLDHATSSGFITRANRSLLLSDSDPDQLLSALLHRP